MQVRPFEYTELSLEQVLTDLAVRFVLNCPEEDVESSVRLMFQVEEAHWFYLDFARAQNPSLPMMKMPIFVKTLWQTVKVLKTIESNFTKALKLFSDYKRVIPVRGGIILNEKLDKVLLVRSWNFKSWGFPRGKINKGEDDLVCAIREVLEETGFDMTEYTSRNSMASRNVQGKNYMMFFAAGVPESTKFETRTREEIEEIKWVPIKEVIVPKGEKSLYKAFLLPVFAHDIVTFIERKLRARGSKGKKTDESAALKKLLGISSSEQIEVHNDEESSRELLSLIRGNASSTHNAGDTSVNLGGPTGEIDTVSRDRAYIPNAGFPIPQLYGPPSALLPTYPPHIPGNLMLPHNLPEGIAPNPAAGENSTRSDSSALKDYRAGPGTNTVLEDAEGSFSGEKDNEGAKQILALLNRESSDSYSENADITMDDTFSLGDTTALSYNNMLERLVTSRKSHRHLRHQSVIPTAKPKLKKNSLLQVLNSSSYSKKSKLIDLLRPVDSDSKSDKSPAAGPSSRARGSLMDLLGIQKTPEADETSQSPEENTQSRGPAEVHGSELLKLLGISDAEHGLTNTTQKPEVPNIPELSSASKLLHSSDGSYQPDLPNNSQVLNKKDVPDTSQPHRINKPFSLLDLIGSLSDPQSEESNKISKELRNEEDTSSASSEIKVHVVSPSQPKGKPKTNLKSGHSEGQSLMDLLNGSSHAGPEKPSAEVKASDSTKEAVEPIKKPTLLSMLNEPSPTPSFHEDDAESTVEDPTPPLVSEENKTVQEKQGNKGKPASLLSLLGM